jgi:hypothetical protein
MAEIKTSEGSLYLYTHWGGSKLPEVARDAVERARPRLGDEPYWVRIVIDQIFKNLRDKETGGGIMLKPHCEDEYNYDKPSVILDAIKGTVEVIERRREE